MTTTTNEYGTATTLTAKFDAANALQHLTTRERMDLDTLYRQAAETEAAYTAACLPNAPAGGPNPARLAAWADKVQAEAEALERLALQRGRTHAVEGGDTAPMAEFRRLMAMVQ